MNGSAIRDVELFLQRTLCSEADASVQLSNLANAFHAPETVLLSSFIKLKTVSSFTKATAFSLLLPVAVRFGIQQFVSL